MNCDIGVLRAIENAVDALARLDEQVAGTTPGVATLLMLRAAQAIVAANDRPTGGAADDKAGDTVAGGAVAIDGAVAFAALLGWWYAPESRGFIADDPHLRGVARALDSASGSVRGGRVVTAGLLDDAARAADLDVPELSPLLDATLSMADQESWPALLVVAELCSGACGRERSVSASLARAVAPLSGGLGRDVFVAPGYAGDAAGVLHALANDARAMQRRVAAYREALALARERCHAFGRGGASASALVEWLAGHPAVTVQGAARVLAHSAPTAGAAVDRLVDAELLREITGRARDRVFVYTPAATLAL